MTVDIPPDLQNFVQQIVASGRCKSEDEVVDQALRLFQQLETRRKQLSADIQEGIESETIPGDVAFQQLEQLAQEIAT